jgi:hypothetical protein
MDLILANLKLNSQFAFIKFKLSQTQYKKGFLFISALVKDGAIQSVDFRFYIDNEVDYIPTKNGFRIPITASNDFLHQLTQIPTDGDYCYELTKERSIYIRYIEDSKGEFIDIRNHVKSEKYSGWTRQGIRFLLSDYEKLQNEVNDFINNKFSIQNYDNLFESKVVTTRPKSKKKTTKVTDNSSNINPGLLNIINS